MPMIDARCAKCGKRLGWAGEASDWPTCPRCGHRLDQTAIDHDQAEVDSFRELLRERMDRSGATGFWNRAIFAAGLTTGQAARVLGVDLVVLLAIAEGRADPLPGFAAEMLEAYGLDPSPDIF